VTFRLIGQCIGKRRAHRTSLAADQQIDVRNLIPLTHKGFTNIQNDVAGHGLFLLVYCRRQKVEQPIRSR
jgi:hypothetical protein